MPDRKKRGEAAGVRHGLNVLSSLDASVSFAAPRTEAGPLRQVVEVTRRSLLRHHEIPSYSAHNPDLSGLISAIGAELIREARAQSGLRDRDMSSKRALYSFAIATGKAISAKRLLARQAAGRQVEEFLNPNDAA